MHHDDGIEPQHQCPPSVIVVSLVVFALLTASLAFTTSTLRHWRARTAPDSDTPTQVWDESYMVPVVQEIIRDNWSHASMLDYQDTKGPVLFWAYAAWGQVCGSEASSLRSLSMLLATLCAWPAALIAWRVWRYTEQTYRQKAWLTVLSVALIWLLPYQPVLSQLFMSEPLFNLLSLWAVACAIIGFERQTDPKRHALPWALTVAYTLVLVLLVHVRVQAVVIAGAVCLTAVLTVGIRGSACWWMASAIAGLSRIPLWLRWDGLVSPEFQDRYGLGFRLDALTYVVVALLPISAVFLWLPERQSVKRTLAVAGAAAVFGALLGFAAQPDLALTSDSGRYMGLVATFFRDYLPASSGIQTVAWISLSALGCAALGCVVLHTQSERADSDRSASAVCILSLWLIVVGWLLHALTRGDIYDRYLLPFVLTVPLVWLRVLPVPLVAALVLILMFVNAMLIATHLVL
ncbi:MAG: hypothetical protein D8M59_16190 [Planctomycetes bacterium]|nr:hypothetical protein [Planctomycetota bacterium]